MLLLLIGSWLCCDAGDDKSELLRDLLRNYEKDIEPPLADGITNTTVGVRLTLLCATPISDLVSIEGWTAMVSRAGAADTTEM